MNEPILGFAPLEGRSGHAAGRALLADLIREHWGRPLPEIRLSNRGKPYFPDFPVYFSISHTPRHVFVALSSRPVGIDAEEQDRKVRLKLAEKILSPAELLRFRAAGSTSRALLRLWVLKEAQVKCLGTGLQGYPNHTDFSPEDPRIREICGCYVAVITKE